MALETNDNNEAFISGGGGEDDFAALDSMGLTGQSQYGMNTVHMSSSIDNIGSNNNVSSTPTTTQTAGGSSGGVSDDVTSGFSGVSGSLFDRIKARTAEQQKATTQQPPAPQQEAAQSSSQQSAFMSQQQQQQPPSGEVTMELERHRSDEFNSSAPTNLASGMPSQNQNTAIPNTNNETTYSFSASGAGEDFSQQAQQQMRVPDYGVNRYAGAAGNNQQQYPQNIQDQALSTMKTLWSTGINSAQNTIAIAQQKMGIETNGSDATPRSYNNNFLLREDSMESGGIGATMQQVPPEPISAAQFDPEHVQAGSSSNNASGMSGIMGEQGYSMLQYGKTFCEDMYAFVMQLPPVGKGAVGIILLWILYVLFG